MDGPAHGLASAVQTVLELFSAHPEAPCLPPPPPTASRRLQQLLPVIPECPGIRNGVNNAPVGSGKFSKLP